MGQIIKRAYLDIETDGLSRGVNNITVIGIMAEYGGDNAFYQFYGKNIDWEWFYKFLKEIDCLYTYNGSSFDLKFIESKSGINVHEIVSHCDLKYECWKRNLYGGLKSVEKQLGIIREMGGMNGYDAVRLWYDYLLRGNRKALDILLRYNREDVMNLSLLRKRLNVY